MHLRCHVDRCAHLGRHESIERLCESEVAELEMSVICNQNVLQFDVHVGHACLLVEPLNTIDQLFTDSDEQWLIFYN